MVSKHRVTVGEELRYDSDLQTLKNLNGTYIQRAGGTSSATAPLPFVNAGDYGMVGDGATNNGPALLQLLTVAKNSKSSVPFSLASDPVGNKTIYLPAGDFVITDIAGLLGQENMTSKVNGLRIVGAGTGLTRIIFKPTTAGDLMQNDFWLNLQFEGITFYAATPGCTFMHSSTTHNAQRYQFINCSWQGFKYAFYLEGNNNNSEFCFVNCHGSGFESTGAFLRIPGTGSDQFLNYWFFGCTWWSTSAPFIDADKGGHFRIYGLDASDWGAALSSPGYLFKLNGTTHALGVCTFRVDALRVEAKNANAALLYSEWPYGSVSFTAADWSSQTGSFTYGDIITIKYQSNDGCSYVFRDCTLAGGVRVSFATNDWAHLHKILFDCCQWMQKSSPSDVVTYDGSGAGVNTQSLPPVKFRDCRGTAVNAMSAGGAAVWDCTIGYRGDLMQSLAPRVVAVRGVNGLPADGNTVTVLLPVGALITGFQALSPSGAVTEGDGGSWTLATSEATPTLLATTSFSSALSGGFNSDQALTLPFECSNANQAKLTVTSTGVNQGTNSKGLLLIKGYW